MSIDRDGTRADTLHQRTPMQRAAQIVGAVFVLVGVLGFVPGITTDYDSLSFASHESGAMLLGVFQVSVLHNIVHLLFGVAGLAMSRSWTGARNYLVGGGVVYLLLFLYGLLIDKDSSANFVPVNSADDWLHLVLGLGMVALGLTLARGRDALRTSDDRAATGTASRAPRADDLR